MEKNSGFITYSPQRYTDQEMIKRSENYLLEMNNRRSVREFSDRSIPLEVIENIIKTASTAPSGAHKQPWVFCLVSNPQIKRDIRLAAEEEEKQNYGGRMSDEWLKDLEPFETTWQKPFLEIAPYLIVVFKKVYELKNDEKKNNYYVNESVGLATGILLSAIHHAGLVALTHTPSPLNFLSKILHRPPNERPFLLIPVGYPEKDVKVPNIKRKGLHEILVNYP